INATVQAAGAFTSIRSLPSQGVGTFEGGRGILRQVASSALVILILMCATVTVMMLSGPAFMHGRSAEREIEYMTVNDLGVEAFEEMMLEIERLERESVLVVIGRIMAAAGDPAAFNAELDSIDLEMTMIIDIFDALLEPGRTVGRPAGLFPGEGETEVQPTNVSLQQLIHEMRIELDDYRKHYREFMGLAPFDPECAMSSLLALNRHANERLRPLVDEYARCAENSARRVRLAARPRDRDLQ